jgi:hypothetical protein
MARQSLLWTALPNGYSPDGKALRLSVLLSPRLEAQTDPERLKTFPDFHDWPETVRRSLFTVSFGNSPAIDIPGDDTTSASRVDSALGVADTAVWQALFPLTTFVRGFSFKDLSDHRVISYDAAAMDRLVRKLYTRLAAKAGRRSTRAFRISQRPRLE